ncbi:hypothetical protein [Peribacillus loiseleuriae]|uniref:hypothetical protein n=1 Tax=Peribacillus loiseleuriae TaxID=1679170 RepID=UPI003D06999C
MESVYSTAMYWLVVYDKRTGQFKNADYLYQAGKNLDVIKKRFEKRYPDYQLMQAGEGSDNRPEPAKNLPYIDENKKS